MWMSWEAVQPASGSYDQRLIAGLNTAVGGMTERVPGVDAWELWNEPDGSEFFAGGPQPARYAAMLKSAYGAIKAVQPGDTVVAGGMVGNDMDFLAALYDHGSGGRSPRGGHRPAGAPAAIRSPSGCRTGRSTRPR
jgi:hypothetical protein